jgi:hypothetical protein
MNNHIPKFEEFLNESSKEKIELENISDVDHTRIVKFLANKFYDNQYDITKSKNGFVIDLKSVSDREAKELKDYLKHQEYIKESVNESRAKTSDLLSTVVRGSSTRVEGTKVSKIDAEKLIKIYNLMDMSGRRKFDEMKVSDLLKAYAEELKM